MIDPGLIAIGLIDEAIWSWRGKKSLTVPTDHTRTQPGRRLEGTSHVGGGDTD